MHGPGDGIVVVETDESLEEGDGCFEANGCEVDGGGNTATFAETNLPIFDYSALCKCF